LPTRLDGAGILLYARGDRLSVASRAPLTDRQRAWICAHKWELLQLLADLAPPAPALTGDDREAKKGRATARAPGSGESREASASRRRLDDHAGEAFPLAAKRIP
jgi:hypothetical protein